MHTELRMGSLEAGEDWKAGVGGRVSQVGDTHPRRDTLSWGHDFQFISKNLTSKIMLDSREKYFFSHKNYIKKPSRMVQPIFSADLKSAIGIFISLKK